MAGVNELINVGDFGVPLYFDMLEDVSGNVNEVVLQKPDGTEITVLANVGVADLDSSIGTLKENQYVSYVIEDGDIDQAGSWKVKCISKLGSTVKRTTPWRKLEVIE